MTQKTPRYTIALSLAFATAALTGLLALADRHVAADKIRPYVTWSGPDSAIQMPKYECARNEKDWAALWEKHSGAPLKRDNVQQPFMPHVDFEQCVVVAVFKGPGVNSNGVIVSEIVEEPDRILFRYDESTYQVSFGLNDKPRELPKVYPFGIFVLPKTSKPIVLQENTQGLKDEPPKWTERAKLN